MPAGFAWFRAQVDNPRNRPQIERILPHAVEAEWSMPPDLSPAALAAHFSRGTPPGTITGLVAPHAAITQVVQPVAARGGFAGEDEGAFVNRVSERLRHKGRAVTPRDYERILLEQHPEVFYARAIPPEKAGEANKIVVLVVPVARSPVARLPFFSAGELGAMADELKAAASPLVDLQVVNPIYEEIDLRIGVAFRQDRSHRYYAAKLITELRHFVSPWLYRQSEPSDPGRKFHPAEFAALIQRLDWVECLAQCLVSRNGTEEHGEFGPSDRRKLCVLGEKIAIGLPNP
jgi:hypothetical protein